MTFRPRHEPERRGPARPGLSLLEVVIALAILLFSIVAISQLISLGSDRALDVQQYAQATLLCQRKLAEVMVGAEPLTATGYSGFPDQENLGDWQWKLDATQSDTAGLWNVQVTVKYDRGNNTSFEVQLAQMMLDPTMRGSNQDPPPNQNSTTTGTDTGSSNNTSGASNNNSGTPAASAPKTTTPAASTPRTSTPKTSTPKTTTPKSSTPSTPSTTPTTPAPSTPSATTPAETPAPSAPSSTTPSSNTPANTSTTGKGG